MKLEQVIEDVIQECLIGTSSIKHYAALLAERIRREFCVKEHDWDWFFDEHKGWWKCTRCGAEKQEEK